MSGLSMRLFRLCLITERLSQDYLAVRIPHISSSFFFVLFFLLSWCFFMRFPLTDKLWWGSRGRSSDTHFAEFSKFSVIFSENLSKISQDVCGLWVFPNISSKLQTFSWNYFSLYKPLNFRTIFPINYFGQYFPKRVFFLRTSSEFKKCS